MAYTTINKHTAHFNTKLYTGNGTSQSITGVGHQPDWIWIKNRDTTAWHTLVDVLRGTGKTIYSNRSDAEGTYPSTVSSFDSDGFTVGNSGDTNNNGSRLVSWNWKANGSGSSNTNGTITSTVSANTTAGFSIVSYTGDNASTATIGHGLSSAPELIFSKNRDTGTSADWATYHKDLSANKNIFLNSTGAEVTPSYGTITGTTSSLINVSKGGGNQTNSSHNFIMYCFASVPGYSKIGSYIGNGNADGPFIYTGFKPAWLLVKRAIGGTQDWQQFDNKMNPSNVASLCTRPNQDNGEQTGNAMDLLSNGFKNRLTGSSVNTSGDTYIYMAFGQSLVGSNDVPCTAR